MDIKEFVRGCIGGALGIVICYPADTIKTLIQTAPPSTGFDFKHFIKNNGIRDLYPGFTTPLAGMIAEKTLLFGTYDMLTPWSGRGWAGGAISGVISTSIITPIERIKIRAQANNISAFNSIKGIMAENGLRSFYRGQSATLLREVPGYAIYFHVFEKLKPESQNPNLALAFGRGICCGVASWAVIYPSDPVKTIMQNDNILPIDAIKKIYKNYGFRGFYRGYGWALGKAGLLHGGVILGYELSQSLL